jgi:toxin FitB
LSYLIDTNVLSELRRKKPDPRVVQWFSTRTTTQLHVSVLTLGEIRKGIEQIGVVDATRKAALLDWLEIELPTYFGRRLLSIDVNVAEVWGKLVAKAGRPLPAIDSLLAATAITHQLVVVTRNTRDFSDMGVDVLDPWQTND